jgi:hypothetical protein
MNKQITRQIPFLPDPYQQEIYKAGGYIQWRDAVLLEHSKVPNSKVQKRANAQMRKRPTTRKRQFFTEADNHFLIKNYHKMDAKKIAKILNKKVHQVYNQIYYLRKYHILPLKKNYVK